MPYRVSVDEAEESVVVRVWGEASPADHRAARDESCRLLREKKLSRLLVDLRDLITRGVVTADRLKFGTSAVELLPPGCRVAHLLPADAETRQDVALTSAVEHHQGRLTAEFETESAARKWLTRA